MAQVYVIHQTGLVILSRKYTSGCVSSDPQLIGGFLAALLTFARVSKNEVESCQWEDDGKHQLKDIGMSCSRWFIKTVEEYTIAVLVQYHSPLLVEQRFDLINTICDQILSTFLIFQMFDVNVEENIGYVKDYSDDFGNTIDNIAFEQIREFMGDRLKFEVGGQLEVFQHTTP
ncbi:MAG: hypothetical protein GPJ54_04305 [Candidatus Heimdallarchaeota archaeon]|nr:hypothetical protein [Candidatus Heimdallarchaeota archaeon]